MDQSTALHKLLEAADLVKMIEDLTSPGIAEKLSAPTLSGIRVTLRNVRQNLMNSHDALAADIVSRAKARMEASPMTNTMTANLLSPLEVKREATTGREAISNSEVTYALKPTALADPDRLQMKRKDLRSSLEQLVER